jgi:hypothetical protein
LLISSIKLAVPIAIMLLWNALVPLTANALPLSNSGSEGMFLPVPGQSIPTSHNSIYNSISNNPNKSISNSDTQNNPIPSSKSVQLTPGSNLRYYYNKSASWATQDPKDPNGSWNPLLAIAPFLNIPKNLIAPVCPQNSAVNSTTGEQCPPIIGTQRGDIIIATAVNNAKIFGLGGNDVIECGFGNCKVITAFGNNILMSGPSFAAQLYGGSGGYFRPGNNIFIGGGGETLMVGGRGNDQFYAGSNNLFDGGGDIMIGGSGANYFDCGPNGNGVILDFNPAKGDTKAPNCKFVITVPYNNIFGPGLPKIFGALGSFPGGTNQANTTGGPASFPGGNLTALNANQANTTGGPAAFPGGNLRGFNANQGGAATTSNGMSVLPAQARLFSSLLHCCS